jgi:hypothetical protein
MRPKQGMISVSPPGGIEQADDAANPLLPEKMTPITA